MRILKAIPKPETVILNEAKDRIGANAQETVILNEVKDLFGANDYPKFEMLR